MEASECGGALILPRNTGVQMVSRRVRDSRPPKRRDPRFSLGYRSGRECNLPNILRAATFILRPALGAPSSGDPSGAQRLPRGLLAPLPHLSSVSSFFSLSPLPFSPFYPPPPLSLILSTPSPLPHVFSSFSHPTSSSPLPYPSPQRPSPSLPPAAAVQYLQGLRRGAFGPARAPTDSLPSAAQAPFRLDPAFATPPPTPPPAGHRRTPEDTERRRHVTPMDTAGRQWSNKDAEKPKNTDRRLFATPVDGTKLC